jgi:hypothetical protein
MVIEKVVRMDTAVPMPMKLGYFGVYDPVVENRWLPHI